MTLQEDRGFHVMQVNGIDLPIHAFRFDDAGRIIDIFYCYWDARSSYGNDTSAASEDWTMRGRLRAAWKGKREDLMRATQFVTFDAIAERLLRPADWAHRAGLGIIPNP